MAKKIRAQRLRRKDQIARREVKVLKALESGLSIGAAALAGGLSRQGFRNWRERDEAFDLKCYEAIEAGTDRLEDSAYRRGAEGVLKPVYQQGRKVGHVREYSDNMAALILKGRRPEKFKDRQELTGPNGSAIQPILNIQLNVPNQINRQETRSLGPAPGSNGHKPIAAPQAIVSVLKRGD